MFFEVSYFEKQTTNDHFGLEYDKKHEGHT